MKPSNLSVCRVRFTGRFWHLMRKLLRRKVAQVPVSVSVTTVAMATDRGDSS